ncbi:ABC transporter substrate-binding protein [Methylophaga sp. OBS1]|uniref:ABC transporter substrate-binding protein n=1 Tax=Methylophaga sp. OBS1 TaxID=2991933 RepID=UPI0022501B28|nr:ABC transporter substrate-binding protein [Methylophaga sp. OBS1]
MTLNPVYRFLRVLFLFVLSAFITACSDKESALRVATHVWPGYEFLYLGQQLGYIPQEHVTLVDTGSATQSIEKLKQNQADAATLTLDEVLVARNQGLDLTIILIMDISVGADQLIARMNIDSLAQLKGKTIALEETAVGRLLFAKATESAGIKTDAFTLLPATIDQHVDLWREGNVDAIVTYEPAASQILRQGGRVLFDSSQVPDTIVDVLAVRSDLVEEQSAMLHLLVSGFFKAQKHFLTNPQDASYRMSSRLDVPSGEVMYLYQGLGLPNIEHNKKLLSPDNPQLTQVAENILRLGLFPYHQDAKRTQQLFSDEFLP